MVSTSPRRTEAEKRRSSTRKPSAAVAPRAVARASTETRRSARSLTSDLGTAHRHAIDPDGRQTDPDGDGLPVFATGTDTLVELEIPADPAHAGQRIGSVADQGGAVHRRGEAPVLDQIGFAR